VERRKGVSVTFVGAGPGAPDLITLRGAAALAAAEVVIYAGSLVPPPVLSHAPPQAERVDSSSLTLEQVCRIYDRRRMTVRLHSGDLAWYSSINEQIAYLVGQGIPYEVVPGVSAAGAAAAALGRELTVPELSQTVVVTRVGFRTPMPAGETLSDLARHGTTLAIHLGGSRPDELQRSLLKGGYPGDTPCAVCWRVSWPDQEIEECELSQLAETVKGMGHRTTVLVLAGPGLQSPACRATPETATMPAPRSRLYSPGFAHGFRKRSGDRG
jgi:precorrin-4/cobalt-precorrin-4 C11-methyltransferase